MPGPAGQPSQTRILQFTHIENLPTMLAVGKLFADSMGRYEAGHDVMAPSIEDNRCRRALADWLSG